MKKLLTVVLGLVVLAAFADLGVAQQKGKQESPPTRIETKQGSRALELKEVVIQGDVVTLKKGFSFGRIVNGKLEVLDAARQSVISLDCACDSGGGGGCGWKDSGGGSMNCIGSGCKGSCGAMLAPPPSSQEPVMPQAAPSRMMDKAPRELRTGKVTQVNDKAKTFTVMAKGKAVTFSAAKLKALPTVGAIIDITYTENPGGPMEPSRFVFASCEECNRVCPGPCFLGPNYCICHLEHT